MVSLIHLNVKVQVHGCGQASMCLRAIPTFQIHTTTASCSLKLFLYKHYKLQCLFWFFTCVTEYCRNCSVDKNLLTSLVETKLRLFFELMEKYALHTHVAVIHQTKVIFCARKNVTFLMARVTALHAFLLMSGGLSLQVICLNN